MKNILIFIVSSIVFLGCSSLRVSYDYDPGYDFSQQTRYAVVHHNREGEDTLFNDRVINAIKTELNAKGYVQTSKEEADLVFVFHSKVEDKTDIDTDYQMVGFGMYRYGGTMVATTSTYHYTKGTLIVDALNPKDQKIVWRGIATDTLKEKKTPQKRTEYINKVIQELMESFPGKSADK